LHGLANFAATRKNGLDIGRQSRKLFAAGSASTRRSAASDRCRPLTHQESVTLMPADVGWPANTSTPARASMAMPRGSTVTGSSGPSEKPTA